MVCLCAHLTMMLLLNHKHTCVYYPDIPPPEVELSSPMYPGNDDKYKNIPEAASIRTESLKVRFITLYTKDYVSNLTPIC